MALPPPSSYERRGAFISSRRASQGFNATAATFGKIIVSVVLGFGDEIPANGAKICP